MLLALERPIAPARSLGLLSDLDRFGFIPGPNGPRNSAGLPVVLDARVRVHGVARLRFVDASVFPGIPGHYIVSAVHMAAKRAADLILEDGPALARPLTA